MRIVSLVPAATEIVAALGAGSDLVGISHECDYPPSVQHLPRVTSTPIDRALAGGTIDAEVRRLVDKGRPVFTVAADELRRLAPDLLLTQSLCEVCAVSEGTVSRLAAALSPAPAVVALDGRTVGGIFEDIRRVSAVLGLADEAEELIAGLEWRLRQLGGQRTEGPRPRVVCVEWLEPLYLAGHWVPELVTAAGGHDVGASAGRHSERREWHEVRSLSPDLVLVMLCGFDVERTRRELAALQDADARALLERTPTWIVDGNAYTSRSGPRVVDGAERMHAALAGRTMPGLERWRE